MTPFERVLAEPGSIAARRALAEAWTAAGDPRGPLIEKQLLQRDRRLDKAAINTYPLDHEIEALLAKDGRALAGRLAELVDEYRFYRGLVASVTLTGERWQELAPELLELAPVQHVEVTAPLGDVDALFAMPELARLSTLVVKDKTFGDRGAIALARSPHVAHLTFLDLGGDGIGRPGVEALAASPYLAHAIYIHFIGNPADPTPWANVHDGYYGRPELASELEQRFGRRPWLDVPDGDMPDWDELAVTP